MKIFQIVGYKNSGKTTVSTTIINYFRAKGLQVASMKHHGHGGVPVGLENTDSEKHKQAGALLSGVEGEGLLQLSKDKWTLDEILKIYSMMKIELTVIEGFKTYPYPKIVLIRKVEDLHLLNVMEGILAVISRIPMEEDTYPYPIFLPTDMDKLCKWLEEKIN